MFVLFNFKMGVSSGTGNVYTTETLDLTLVYISPKHLTSPSYLYLRNTWLHPRIYTSETPDFTLVFSWICVIQSLVFCVMFCESLFVCSSFISFDHGIVCLFVFYFVWPWNCLSFRLLFRLTMELFVFSSFISFGHGIVCLFVFYFVWPWNCLSFRLLFRLTM
jgi:hypothetical protein